MVEQQSDKQKLQDAVRQNDLQKLNDTIRNMLTNQRDPLIPITAAGQTVMHLAANAGMLNLLQAMIVNWKFSIDKREEINQRTPLFYAASSGHLDVVRYLVESGADINAESIGGETPSMKAAFFGQREVLEYFISIGARMDMRNYTGQSVLDIARINGRQDIVQMLEENVNNNQ